MNCALADNRTFLVEVTNKQIMKCCWRRKKKISFIDVFTVGVVRKLEIICNNCEVLRESNYDKQRYKLPKPNQDDRSSHNARNHLNRNTRMVISPTKSSLRYAMLICKIRIAIKRFLNMT